MRGLALVTGGAGFIGSHLVKQLIKEGYNVRVFDNLSRTKNNIEELKEMKKVEFIQGDIRDKEAVAKSMKDVDYVFHEAAICLNKAKKFPEEAIDVNLKGSFNIFTAAIKNKVKKIIYASTSSVYGQPNYLPIDEKHPKNCKTPYESTKLCAEHMLKFLAGQSETRYIILRYFNVYGKRQSTDAYYTSVINIFIKKILAGESPKIHGKGTQSMDFTHVSDVVSANIVALKREISGEVFNVCKGEENTIKSIAEFIISKLNSELKPEFIERDVFVTRRKGDNTKLKETLGYTPKITLQEGLAELIEDVKANPDLY
ncbi:SDR family NAD(P)-dependent oxidoreductase [Candidatus Woesearchaeota archaeon]|nr:SDR family NAD(P)-dependent oxidoreductase [Candidatus Woesearchaeota archaeon]